MKIELTTEDRALDVRKMFEETNAAADYLVKEGMKLPPEVHDMRSLMKRCIVAEETIAIEPDLAGYLRMSELLYLAKSLLSIYEFAGPAYGEVVKKWLARYERMNAPTPDALQSPATAAPQPGTAPPS